MTRPGEAQAWLQDAAREPGDRCIEWPFWKSGAGYGQTRHPVTGRKEQAHRVAWELYHGEPFPEGLESRHLCHNPGCVNPRHIVPGTPAENGRDKVLSGRQARGGRQGLARLTEPLVSEALRRLASGESQRVVAASLGVSRGAICSAWRGDTWRHVLAPRRPAVMPDQAFRGAP